MPDGEVERIYTKFGRSNRIFILTDTGRIMSRYYGREETRFNLIADHIPLGSKRDNKNTLRYQAARMGYREITQP